MGGSSNPHDILKIKGEKELASYLLDEVQEVYRLQGVTINDKHIEVIVRQMLRWVRVKDAGDTNLLIGEQVERHIFDEVNTATEAEGREPAQAEPMLLGHHQGVALDGELHLGGLLPGDHQGAHRGLDLGQAGPAPRPQGERDHGPPDPGRDGPAALPLHGCARSREPRRRPHSREEVEAPPASGGSYPQPSEAGLMAGAPPPDARTSDEGLIRA